METVGSGAERSSLDIAFERDKPPIDPRMDPHNAPTKSLLSHPDFLNI